MVGRVGLEHRPDTAVRGEDLADVVDHRLGWEAVGQDGTRAGGQETGPEVVDALLRLRERSLGHARRRAAGRVAQVVAVVDVRVAVGPRVGIEPEAVLRVGLPWSVDRWPAIAVPEVDEDVGALRCGFHPRPGGSRRVDLDDVRRVAEGLRGDLIRVVLVVAVVLADRSNDDHDLGMEGRVDRERAGRHRERGDKEGGDHEATGETDHEDLRGAVTVGRLAGLRPRMVLGAGRERNGRSVPARAPTIVTGLRRYHGKLGGT